MMSQRTIQYYNDHAHILYELHTRVSFEEAHRAWLHLLPAAPGVALDVGAGSGRDAAALAARGWEVYAVEPAAQLRALAQRHAHPGAGRVAWLDDALPALERVEALELDGRFDLILASAVWMHVALSERERAFRKLVRQLKPGGLLVITLRHGPAPLERGDHPVDPGEVQTLAARFAVELEGIYTSPDRLDRFEVSWQAVVLRAPDDTRGGLAQLRQIILNDTKSSTYKLALLRALVRVADGASGLARLDEPDAAEVPLGLVAVVWMRLFAPLLDAGMRQQPQGNGGLSFVKDGWRRLMEHLPAQDLLLGRTFQGEEAAWLQQALGDVRQTLCDMPLRYITWPNTTNRVFTPTKPRIQRLDRFTLDAAGLWSLGSLRVPGAIWEAMRRYACWIEPAINLEWARLMRRYDGERAQPLGAYLDALAWPEHARSTEEARRLVEALRAQGQAPACVWTGRRLGATYQIDHCLPFARWPNNDLWNLLPASQQANSAKGDRLPSLDLLRDAEARILAWWERAYLVEASRRARFEAQARASLPALRNTPGALDPADVLGGLHLQRRRLQVDQQLPEWSG